MNIPIIDEIKEDLIPTEPKIRVMAKEDFIQAIECLQDVVMTTAACLGESAELAEPKDKELQKLCLEAQKVLDRITSHIVCRVL